VARRNLDIFEFLEKYLGKKWHFFDQKDGNGRGFGKKVAKKWPFFDQKDGNRGGFGKKVAKKWQKMAFF